MGGGRGRCQAFFFFFPCSADHERDWPPWKVVFSDWQPIRTQNLRNNKQQSTTTTDDAERGGRNRLARPTPQARRTGTRKIIFPDNTTTTEENLERKRDDVKDVEDADKVEVDVAKKNWGDRRKRGDHNNNNTY